MTTIHQSIRQSTALQRLLRKFTVRYISEWVLRYGFAILAAGIFLYPIVWLAASSVKPNWEIYRQPLNLIPSELTFDVYYELFATAPFVQYIINTLIYAVGGGLLSLVFAVLAAYGLSRHRFRGKRPLLIIILLIQLIPGLVSIIPIFLMMRWMGLFDTQYGMVLLYSALRIPWGIWVLKGYFDGIPIELDESAMVDGASRLRIVVSILLPVMLPGLAAAFIIIFIGLWNEFALASVLLRQPEFLPVSVGTYVLLGPDESDFRLTAAASLVNIIPVMIIFSVLQRYLVSGLAAGAVKQ